MEVALFVAASALSLLGGVGVVAARQPIHSALALLVVLASLGVLYLLLLAEFLAVLQVILYAGAILVLFLFVIMLVHARSPELRPSPKLGRAHATSAILSGAVLWALLAVAVVRGVGGRLSPSVPAGFGSPKTIGRVLFTDFVLPFELAGLLLLIGIVAGVVLGKPAERRTPEPRPVPPRIPTPGGRR